jgi:hypothetical protein
MTVHFATFFQTQKTNIMTGDSPVMLASRQLVLHIDDDGRALLETNAGTFRVTENGHVVPADFDRRTRATFDRVLVSKTGPRQAKARATERAAEERARDAILEAAEAPTVESVTEHIDSVKAELARGGRTTDHRFRP